MRKTVLALTVTLLTAAPLFAQETGAGGADAKGYLTGAGGFAATVGNTTGNMQSEGGVRIAPHVMVFGTVGRFGNLQTDLQPTLDTAIALLANQGLAVTGGGSLSARYAQGGLRVEVPIRSRAIPYVLAGLGRARLNPGPQFLFSSGTLPDGSSPAMGADVTTALVSAGAFTTPDASSATMITLGGGAQIRLASHWAVDAGYRYSRIAADSTLSASALSTNGLTFGFGYRF